MDPTIHLFWDYWYFHIPNSVLATLVYTMLARFGLSFFVPRDWNNYIWRFFLRLTDPVLYIVSWITPSYVHGVFMPLFAMFWLTILRVGLWVALNAAGLGPTTGLAAPG